MTKRLLVAAMIGLLSVGTVMNDPQKKELFSFSAASIQMIKD